MTRSPWQAAGFSLPELLIAMTLGLVLVSAALSMLAATSRTNRTLDSGARLQEAGRFALLHMERDVRMAGYDGCAQVLRINHLIELPAASEQRVLFNFDLPFWGWREAQVRALPADTLPTEFMTRYARGDVLLVKHASTPLGAGLGTTVERGSATIDLTQPMVPPHGQLLLLSNCNGSADLFQVSTSGDTAVTRLARARDPGNLWPGNLEPATHWFSARYRPESSELTLAESDLFYVGYRRSARGTLSTETSLRRLRFGQGQHLPDEELVSGVYDLRVLYGLDRTRRGGTDDFRRADAMLSEEDWRAVVAVRIGVLTYDGAERPGTSDPVTPMPFDTTLWDFSGARVLMESGQPPLFVPPDQRAYRFFATTVAARNRMP